MRKPLKKKNFQNGVRKKQFFEMEFLSDQHHFDNPVYSFNSYQKDDGLQPLNNVQKIQVKNNLSKKTNLEKQKLSEEEMSLSGK